MRGPLLLELYALMTFLRWPWGIQLSQRQLAQHEHTKLLTQWKEAQHRSHLTSASEYTQTYLQPAAQTLCMLLVIDQKVVILSVSLLATALFLLPPCRVEQHVSG